MNPPRGAVFNRGRGRGGYRPYFYFKRNGQTIPVHGRSTGQGGQRGGRGGRTRGGIVAQPSNTLQAPPITSSFLRPQFHAAPDDAQQQITSLAIETPPACPGWRLYFYRETCDENSEQCRRIELMESHFKKNVANYDFLDIQSKGYFIINASAIGSDNDLLAQWPTLMNDLLYSPMRTLGVIAIAMHNIATSAAFDITSTEQMCSKEHYFPKIIKPRKIYVRPLGFMPEKPMRLIGNLEVDQLYCVRGVVASIGPVEAFASWIAYRCTKCKQEQALKQKGFPTNRPYSCKRPECQAKAGFVELRSSPFTRITPKQMIRLTEARLDCLVDSEATANKIFLNVELRHDLVDTIYLGEEIVATGILKIRPLQEESEYEKYSAFTGQMEIYMKASSLQNAKYVNHPFTNRDIEGVTMINGELDSFKLLVQSLAPEVHGFEMAKAGVLVSLVGGAGSQIHDEEEINVLLVGDPGVGKSNILQMCSKVSPKAFMVQAKRGASSTSTKLTIATKGRHNCVIESAGLLAAKNGHCSVDDIDRLSSQLEGLMNVLQPQITCMAFPSIFSTVSTPTSIIASANSLRGHYDQSKLLIENIRMPLQMLSEFHLVFILLDKPNKDADVSLTEHIRALHAGQKKNSVIAAKYKRRIKTNDSMNMPINVNEEDEDDYDLAARLRLNAREETEIDLLPAILMKKFIAYSRQQVKPLFLSEASEDLKSFYTELRQQSENAQYSISSRFVKYYRVNKPAFKYLLDVLTSQIQPKKKSFGISPVVKLCTALRFYAEGGYQTGIGKDNDVSVAQCSVSKVLTEVTDIFERHLCSKWITFCRAEERKRQIATSFYIKHGIPSVIGCVDGTHVRIIAPHNNKHLYYNRKGCYSLNVMLVCDHELRIQYVNAGHPGACHDSFIWNSSELRSHLEEQYLRDGSNYWLLGDAGYGLEPWLMTPHRCPQDDSVEMKFNKVHCKCRNVIERTNGVLKNRWRCILGARELHYSPKKAAKIANVCCALHNICIHFKCNTVVDDVQNIDNFSISDTDVEPLATPHYLSSAQSIRNNIGQNL